MTIYRTASFSVERTSLEACRQAIAAFVGHVEEHEPRTHLYVSLQNKEEPTRFVHLMVFEDEAAEEHHRASPAVKEFTRILYPLTLNGVTFVECTPVGPGVAAKARAPGAKAKAGKRAPAVKRGKVRAARAPAAKAKAAAKVPAKRASSRKPARARR